MLAEDLPRRTVVPNPQVLELLKHSINLLLLAYWSTILPLIMLHIVLKSPQQSIPTLSLLSRCILDCSLESRPLMVWVLSKKMTPKMMTKWRSLSWILACSLVLLRSLHRCPPDDLSQHDPRSCGISMSLVRLIRQLFDFCWQTYWEEVWNLRNTSSKIETPLPAGWQRSHYLYVSKNQGGIPSARTHVVHGISEEVIGRGTPRLQHNERLK